MLIKLHDDATNRLLLARFVPRDDGAVNRQAVIDYLRRWGRPVAFYTDKAGHFGQWTRAAFKMPLEEREAKPTESIIRRALGELNIELIQAHSPQAQGDSEAPFCVTALSGASYPGWGQQGFSSIWLGTGDPGNDIFLKNTLL